MDQYVRTCCEGFLPVIHDRSLSIRARMDLMAAAALDTDETNPYSSFYHRPGNQALHEELSLKICRFLLPHVAQELKAAVQSGESRLRYPEVTASYLLHAQIGLMGEGELPLADRMVQIRCYAALIPSAE